MNLFDIHTHKKVLEIGIISIYNAFPSEPETIACKYPFYSSGIHPWLLGKNENLDFDQQKWSESIGLDQVVAIGECGYDKAKGGNLMTQKLFFESQIKLSEMYEKPLIIHCVKAWDQLLADKKTFKPKQAWILHGYRGNKEQADQLIEKGFLFSFGHKFNEETVSQIPTELIFCETDNSDIQIREVYEKIARTKNIELSLLAAMIEQNVRRNFQLLNF